MLRYVSLESRGRDDVCVLVGTHAWQLQQPYESCGWIRAHALSSCITSVLYVIFSHLLLLASLTRLCAGMLDPVKIPAVKCCAVKVILHTPQMINDLFCCTIVQYPATLASFPERIARISPDSGLSNLTPVTLV